MDFFNRLVFLSVLCLGGLLANSTYAQQEPLYTNYGQAGIAYNPAFAGYLPLASVTFIQRMQWPKINGPYTQHIQMHAPVFHKSIGLGTVATNDKQGALKTVSAMVLYAYKINLKGGTLSFGLGGGVKQFSMDNEKYDPKNLDDRLLLTETKFFKPAAIFGILYHSSRVMLAGSTQNLFPFTNSSMGIVLRRHHYFTGSYLLFPKGYFNLVPSFLLKNAEGAPAQMDLNLTVRSKEASLGVGYRTSDVISFKLLLSVDQLLPAIGNELVIGYAFDYSFAEISIAGNGANEVFVQYNFAIKAGKNAIKRKSTSISPAFF